jgi:hypothetical protein
MAKFFSNFFKTITEKLNIQQILLMFTFTLPGFLDNGHKHFQSLFVFVLCVLSSYVYLLYYVFVILAVLL